MDGLTVGELKSILDKFDDSVEVVTPNGDHFVNIDTVFSISDVMQVTDSKGNKAVIISF